MKKYRFNISTGGVLLLAALYFFMDTSSFVALMLQRRRTSWDTSLRSDFAGHGYAVFPRTWAEP